MIRTVVTAEDGKNQSQLLRRTLQANSLFSGASGLAFVLAPGWLAQKTGIEPALAFTAVGLGLLGYAAWLWLTAGKDTVPRSAALLAIGGDCLWVIASIVVLIGSYLPLTSAGTWGIALVADVIGVFAILQLIGLRRLQSE